MNTTPAQQAALDYLKAEFDRETQQHLYIYTDLSEGQKKNIRRRVRLESVFRMGFEPIVYDFEEKKTRLFRSGDTFFCRVRCPHCGREYHVSQRTWMRRHLENKHGDKDAWRRKYDLPAHEEASDA